MSTSGRLIYLPRQERRASRDSERVKEGEVNGAEEDRKGFNKKEKEEEEEEGEEGKSIDYTVISGSPGNKQQFLEDQVTIFAETLPKKFPWTKLTFPFSVREAAPKEFQPARLSTSRPCIPSAATAGGG